MLIYPLPDLCFKNTVKHTVSAVVPKHQFIKDIQRKRYIYIMTIWAGYLAKFSLFTLHITLA